MLLNNYIGGYMNSMIKVLMVAMVSLVLSACGGGGGGGGGGGNPTGVSGCTDNTATNYNSAATTDDGSCTYAGGGGGSGNAAYYGFSTDSATALTNQTSPLTTGTNQMTITSEVTFNLRNLNTRIMDVMIYQPTCVAGVLTETYSAVLIDGATTAASVATIIVSASGVTFQERGVLSGIQMYDVNSQASVSGTCSSGNMNLGSSGTLFSNGKLMLWRTGAGDLYMGGRSSSIETVMANMQLKQYDKFEQIDNNSINPSNALSTWTSGDVGQVVTDTSASSSHSSFANSSGNTNVKGFASNTPNARYAANANGYSTSTNQHTRAWTNLSSDVPFYGFGISSLGTSGKAISVASMRRSASSTQTANDGTTTVETLKGSGAVLFHVQK